MIPKIIHYCWFGDSPIPEEYENYIKEWKKISPGFKIQKWDEHNSPVNLAYLKTAKAEKNWANMSNLVRFYALKEHGGIYMDTDMKLIKQVNPLLKNECFFGFEEGSENSDVFWVNNAIMGSVPGHSFIELCYNSILKQFDGTEAANVSAPQIVTKLLKQHNKLSSYGLQNIDGVTLYPKDVFYPIPWDKVKQTKDYKSYVTKDTIAVHMWGRTWFSKEMMLQMIDDLQEWKAERTIYLSNLENQLNNEKIDNLGIKEKHNKDIQFIEQLKQQLSSYESTLNNLHEKLNVISEDEKLTFEICESLISFVGLFEQTITSQHTIYSKLISDKEGYKELISRIESYATRNESQISVTSEKLYSKQIAIENLITGKSLEFASLSDKFNTLEISFNKLLDEYFKGKTHITALDEHLKELHSLMNEVEASIKSLHEQNTEIQSKQHTEVTSHLNTTESHLSSLSEHLKKVEDTLHLSIEKQETNIIKRFDDLGSLIKDKNTDISNIYDRANQIESRIKELAKENTSQYLLLKQHLDSFHADIQEKERTIKELEKKIEQKDISIEWYKNTFERRSILGILKDRITRK